MYHEKRPVIKRPIIERLIARRSATRRAVRMKKIITVLMISIMTMMLTAGCGDEQAESTFESWKPEDKSSEAALKMATIEGNYSLAKATYGERFSNIRFGCEYYIKDKLEKESPFSSCGIDKSEKSGIVGVFFEKGASCRIKV